MPLIGCDTLVFKNNTNSKYLYFLDVENARKRKVFRIFTKYTEIFCACEKNIVLLYR